jgi:hypothetical protein
MDDWLTNDEQELWETFFEDSQLEEDTLLANFLKLFGKQITWRRKKKSIDEEEEIGSYYNVCVYRVLPYPPNTKDTKDFFVQRTY